MTSRPISITARAHAGAESSASHLAMGIVVFALLTAIGAMIRIPLPFTPVPLTLQTLFVVLAGVYLGARAGALSQLLYLGLGAAGLPWFAGGAGVSHFFGATGGFLLAFPVAAAFVGALLRPGASVWRAVAVIGAANIIVFSLGAGWLAQVLGVSATHAFALAVLPFLPGAAIKTAITTALVVRGPFSR